MQKTRLLTILMATCLLVTCFSLTSVFAADDMILLYVEVPEDWENPCLWAWSDDGTNAFESWPGEPLEADPDNPGWYYSFVPVATVNLIVNANDSEVQTSDFTIEPKAAWISITDAETVDVVYEQQTEGDLPEYVERFTVTVQVPEDWDDVRLWAWSDPDGKNVFDTWPGEPMHAGEDGYSLKIPIWVNRIIVNANGGEVQTEDLAIDPADIWVTVASAEDVDFTYDDPSIPDVADITVHVAPPTAWDAPNLWAWSAPDGTNVFTSWPGEPLVQDDEGWYALEIPGWVNSVIVNGNGGEVQTEDVSIEAGKDIWLIVADDGSYELHYEAVDLPAQVPAEEESVEEEPTEEAQKEEAPAAEAPAETETAPEPAESEAESNTGWIVGGIVIAIAAIVGIVYGVKNKKQKEA